MLDNWPDPGSVKDIAGFVAALRRLRTSTGLSFRQLERRAERNGDVLPTSTISAALSRDRLPRPDLVEAFVRACGGDEPTVTAWLAVRADLAAGIEEEAEAPDEVVEPVRRRRGLWLVGVGVAVVIAVGLVVTVRIVADREAPTPTSTVTKRPPPPPGAIALAHTGLCVGEGPEHKEGADRIVLGQYDCATASPPISIEPASPGVYRLVLLNADQGPGCATVDEGGALIERLLSGQGCEEGRPDQEFVFEPVDKPVAGYLLHSVAGRKWCIGAYNGSFRPGTQLIQVPCDGGAHQVFLVPSLP